MSAEETELTFIRCPGCRSLVPAVATRCRMCGQLLEVKGGESEDSGEKRSRVRQRTMSVTGEDVETVKEQFSPKPPPPQEEDDFFGPSHDEDHEEQPDNWFSNRREEPEEEEEIPATKLAAVFSKAAEEEAPLEDEFEEEEGALDELEADDEEGEEISTPVQDTGDVRKKRKRRRRKKKRQGEGLGVAPAPMPGQGRPAGFLRDEEPMRQEPSLPAQPAIKPVEQESRPRFSLGGDPHREPVADRPPVQQERKAPPVVERSNQQPLRQEPVAPVQRVPERQIVAAEPTQAKKATPSGLIGWLVAFDNGVAAPLEIVGGKFFIGGERLRPSDFVVEDASVSTPHCLAIAQYGKIQIQDLMSDAGTYVRRAGAGDFVRLSEVVELTHGDTVRFGEVEFTLCLIPFPK